MFCLRLPPAYDDAADATRDELISACRDTMFDARAPSRLLFAAIDAMFEPPPMPASR